MKNTSTFSEETVGRHAAAHYTDTLSYFNRKKDQMENKTEIIKCHTEERVETISKEAN